MSDRGISVVMTTYNGAKFLSQQIESLLAQNLQPAEIVICDDCSTDATPDILSRYAGLYGIRYYINDTRLGVIENFKKAVALSAPDNYIALCDQDDIWLPNKLKDSAATLAAIDDGDIPAMTYSNLTIVDEKGTVLNPSLNSSLGFDKFKHCLSTLVFGNFVLGCTVLMNPPMRRLFAQIPDHPAFNHDAWITMIGFTFGKAVSLSGSYVLYRQHATNVTFSRHKDTRRYERILKHLKNIFTDHNYLLDRIALLKEFQKVYASLLTAGQLEDMQVVLDLEKASYLKKKIALEKAFRGRWINRF
jgi:glycosyltransferase involved in cell wall biosynthesis